MSPEQMFFSMISAMSRMTGADLDEIAISLYHQALKPLGYEQVNNALKAMFEDINSRSPMPSIKQIKEKIGVSELDSDDMANIIAGKITGAVRKYGYNSPEAARKYIGEEGWAVVEMQGGWARICEHLSDDQIPIYHAQWRKMIQAVLKNPEQAIGKRTALNPDKEPHRVISALTKSLRVVE